MRATGSPTKRTSSSASGGRGVSGLSGPVAVCHCSLAPGFRSAAVNTKCTPGTASALVVSMAPSVARANGLRMKYACSNPGKRHVVDEHAVAGEQARVLDPMYARADVTAGPRDRRLRHASFAAHPPSTGMMTPLRYDARSEARNAPTSATSMRLPAAVHRRLLEHAGNVLGARAHRGVDEARTEAVRADALRPRTRPPPPW